MASDRGVKAALTRGGGEILERAIGLEAPDA